MVDISQENTFYHVFNKSIANYGIFKNPRNCHRILNILSYYNNQISQLSYSKFIKKNKAFTFPNILIFQPNNLTKILSYCIMPDHYHLLIKISLDQSLPKFISIVENSFTRYFNVKNNRKGPLWQSRFKSVRIKNQEQLLHVSRYIHLNPVTSFYVDKPEDWEFSSYKYFLKDKFILDEIITEFGNQNIKNYQKFVDDQIDYQRNLKKIKKTLVDTHLL